VGFMDKDDQVHSIAKALVASGVAFSIEDGIQRAKAILGMPQLEVIKESFEDLSSPKIETYSDLESLDSGDEGMNIPDSSEDEVVDDPDKIEFYDVEPEKIEVSPDTEADAADLSEYIPEKDGSVAEPSDDIPGDIQPPKFEEPVAEAPRYIDPFDEEPMQTNLGDFKIGGGSLKPEPVEEADPDNPPFEPPEPSDDPDDYPVEPFSHDIECIPDKESVAEDAPVDAPQVDDNIDFSSEDRTLKELFEEEADLRKFEEDSVPEEANDPGFDDSDDDFVSDEEFEEEEREFSSSSFGFSGNSSEEE